jgi:photosystem II stability/assembly factor-like uncharacterized protein
MRGKQLVFSLTGFLGFILISGIIFFQPTNLKQDVPDLSGKSTISLEEKFERYSKEPRKGPELEKWYFERWHQPFGAVLSPELLNQMRSEVNDLPDESGIQNSPNLTGWQSIGPDRMSVPNSNAGYSGRILDIDVLNNGDLLIAAASGGLWKLTGSTATPLSDGVLDLAVATMTVNPNNQNNIWIGTGEYGVRGGSGLYVTNDAGGSWSNVAAISPTPNGFYKLRYWPGYPNEIHAATTSGYFRSSDGGTTWSRNITGNISDFTFTDASTPGRMFSASWGENKIYQSTTFGATWSEIALPFTDVGRASLSWQSGTLYAGIAKNSDNTLLGVYKSTDFGSTWTNISPPDNYLGNQGWYDNIIMSPSANTIYVGGVYLWKTTNNGTSWNQINDLNVHADQHRIILNASNSEILLGNDGGLTRSTDNGATWSTSTNKIPITQYVNIDVYSHNIGFVAGGSQDNGTSITTDLGATWTFVSGGDGGGVAIDPDDNNKIFITNGVYGGDWTFRRLRTSDRGVNWTHINNGIDPSTQWYNRIRHDQVSPVYIFNNSGPYAYQSTNSGDDWIKLNTTPFASDISELTVARWTSTGKTIVYACMPTTTGTKLWVYIDGTWFSNRFPGGLPTDVWVKKITPHSEDYLSSVMIMNGISQQQPGSKIFRTNDLGLTWTNITGNLPNIPFSDVVVHPTNGAIIIASSEMGCYRTDNGGQTWIKWNLGMPDGSIVTELRYVNELSSTGKLYIVAGTYGRGIYVRELNDGSINSVEDERIPVNYDLAQNYPNPFNPSTSISFSLPQNDNVELKVFNIQGEEVATLINRNLEAGKHEVKFVANNLASGIYIYKIKTSRFTLSKKMTLLK